MTESEAMQVNGVIAIIIMAACVVIPIVAYLIYRLAKKVTKSCG